MHQIILGSGLNIKGKEISLNSSSSCILSILNRKRLVSFYYKERIKRCQIRIKHVEQRYKIYFSLLFKK